MTGNAPSSDLCCLLSAGVLTAGPPAGKPEWRPAMDYVTELRQRSIFPAEPPLPYDWLDIVPGYVAGPAFGHIDLAHQILDFVPDDPELARRQLLNQLALQRPDGSIAFLYLRDNPHRFWQPYGLPVSERLRGTDTFPPFWPVAVEACLRYGRPDGARELLEKALDCTAAQFARTGTVWEFHHPEGGNPEDLVRKPGRAIKGPCSDYLGHNPLHAMAGVWSYLKQFHSDRETQAWRST